MEECQCIPWYIPKANDTDLPYCSLDDVCFNDKMSEMAANLTSCNCLSDCEEISLTVLPSNKEIHLPKNACTGNSSQQFASDLCDLCIKTVKHFRIRLTYNHIMFGHPNPDNLDDFCEFFVRENVAIVQVEYASDSMIRYTMVRF